MSPYWWVCMIILALLVVVGLAVLVGSMMKWGDGRAGKKPDDLDYYEPNEFRYEDEL